METSTDNSSEQSKNMSDFEQTKIKKFLAADEVRNFQNGKLELLKFGYRTIGRATLNPGWRWSTSLKEIAQTDSCQAPHFQYHVSGIIKVKMDNGDEYEIHPEKFP